MCQEHSGCVHMLLDYIVACHLPRAPSYGGMKTWVEGSQMRGDRFTQALAKHQYDKNNN